ncbi:hypothetical protein I3842_05G219900 [Carya illinoinensis]|uniref:Uncharacterized protein n=1 Tax=Carya illinoinensis TaxID=32201 RepID=A0A922F6H6_CARIL|nr:hypothetical protein I3842_05G219900 [Carya illinoinensis]
MNYNWCNLDSWTDNRHNEVCVLNVIHDSRCMIAYSVRRLVLCDSFFICTSCIVLIFLVFMTAYSSSLSSLLMAGEPNPCSGTHCSSS